MLADPESVTSPTSRRRWVFGTDLEVEKESWEQFLAWKKKGETIFLEGKMKEHPGEKW